MLGVLVLVVVMSVYSGLERDVKARLLGFSPHVLLTQPEAGPMVDWREPAALAKKIPHVLAATAYIADNAIIDVGSFQRPVLFRGVDTSDPSQVEGIDKLLDKEAFPNSSADMGLDDRAVISSTLADQFKIGVGAEIRLISARNSEQILEAFKVTENPPVREFYAEEWKKATQTLAAGWKENGGSFSLPQPALDAAYNGFESIYSRDIREAEKELLGNLLIALEAGKETISGTSRSYDAAAKAEVDKAVAAVAGSDPEKMDAEALKGLKSLVLPKKALVIGVYKASQMAATPDVFIPLPLAQNLAGLQDSVQGIALRLDNADLADKVALTAPQSLGPGWSTETWGQQYVTFFNLINQQRAMMYFALSFIVLISAFSMMAVMFTVTIQKRREIGVMKALGAAPGQIVRVFLYQGMILGVLGAILGVGLGRLVIYYRGGIQALFRQVGFDPFSSQFTGFGILPAHNDPIEQLMFAVMAFILCSLAALVPAFFAARSDAAKSLRNL